MVRIRYLQWRDMTYTVSPLVGFRAYVFSRCRRLCLRDSWEIYRNSTEICLAERESGLARVAGVPLQGLQLDTPQNQNFWCWWIGLILSVGRYNEFWIA